MEDVVIYNFQTQYAEEWPGHTEIALRWMPLGPH